MMIASYNLSGQKASWRTFPFVFTDTADNGLLMCSHNISYKHETFEETANYLNR